MDHYDALMALIQQSPGMSVRAADSRGATARYLERNPGLSFCAEEDGQLIGCALCGHDGRRGYLQHVVVAAPFRGRGIAQALVERCLDRLAAVGIEKTHLDVLLTNDLAMGYWRRRGWIQRQDIQRFSFIRSTNPNA